MATETIVETVITANGGDSIDPGEVEEAVRAVIAATNDTVNKGGGEPQLRIRGVKNNC